MNNLLSKVLFGFSVLAVVAIIYHPRALPEPAHAQARGVEYTFASGFGPVLESQLTEAAAKGWRAKGIALGQNSIIVVLMERPR